MAMGLVIMQDGVLTLNMVVVVVVQAMVVQLAYPKEAVLFMEQEVDLEEMLVERLEDGVLMIMVVVLLPRLMVFHEITELEMGVEEVALHPYLVEMGDLQVEEVEVGPATVQVEQAVQEAEER